MTDTKLPARSLVACVEHDGAHLGTIVHDLGFAYAVAWRNLNTDREIGKAHAKDATHVAYDQVTEVVACVYCDRPLAGEDHVRGCPDKPEFVWTVQKASEYTCDRWLTCWQADGRTTAHYRNFDRADQRAIELAGANPGATYRTIKQAPEDAWMLTRLG
jgi:hypothetical protein